MLRTGLGSVLALALRIVRGVLVELPDPKALTALLDRGERDRELGLAPASDLSDGEWLTLTVRVGLRDTQVPARARDLGEGPSLVLSERDWKRLRSFARFCKEDSKSSHPPSGITAIVRGHVCVLTATPCLGKLISTSLATIGVGADVCCSAEEMIGRITESPTDIVVLDSQIPDACCNALCQRLHSIARRPSVLLLVASSSPNDDVCSMTFGADDFLLTPFRPQELLARIVSLLHQASVQKHAMGVA
ncbi:MAG TPA: response regulator [Polyangiaceae bacterium]